MSDIDRQVADQVLKQVFGCDEVWTTGVNFFHAKKDGQFFYEGACDDWNFAGLIVEKMRELGFGMCMNLFTCPNHVQVKFVPANKIHGKWVEGDMPVSLAICRASLAALEAVK